MFKKIIVVILLLVVWIGLMALSISHNSKFIRITSNGFNVKPIDIPKQNGCKINTMHPYEMIETENGYDLIIHFIKE